MPTSHDDIPGTYVFNGQRAQIGYPLNRMCMSFNSAANRAEFLADPEAYYTRYGLTDDQKEAVRTRDVLRLIKLGGNIYYLAKLAGIYGLNVQDVGAQQRGVTVEEFKARLVAAGAE